MNILYLSHLGGESFAGPTYSVPKQIEAQSKLDNVFWYNASKSKKTEWKNFPFYHDIDEYPNESIESLPNPFNHPDIIVVECFYNMAGSNLRMELIKKGIPYVIVPRGELTEKAQERKGFKKKIANLLWFNAFARKAASIHYLTEQEKNDSGKKWNKEGFVIPNGIVIPKRKKTTFNKNLKLVFIGRIEPYQKGLDLLIEACSFIKNELIDKSVTISIYGPDREDKLNELKKQVKASGLNKVIDFYDAVYGEEKENILLNSDVFVLTSRFEGHPMALIEALSYGLPCLVTQGSNMKEIVQDNDAGWTAECETMSLKAGLLHILNSSVENLIEKGKNAYVLSQKYSWDIIAKETHRKFRLLVKDDCDGR